MRAWLCWRQGWRLWEYLADVSPFPAWFARLSDQLTLGATILVLTGMFLLALPVGPG